MDQLSLANRDQSGVWLVKYAVITDRPKLKPLQQLRQQEKPQVHVFFKKRTIQMTYNSELCRFVWRTCGYDFSSLNVYAYTAIPFDLIKTSCCTVTSLSNDTL